MAPPTPDFAKTLDDRRPKACSARPSGPSKTAGSDKWLGSAQDYAATFAKQFNNREPEYHGAEATAACLAFVLAVEKAGSTDPNKVRDTLAGLDEQTFFGPLKFNEQGQNVTKKMAVIQIQGGKPVAVWPTDSAQGAMKYPGSQ